MSGKPTPRVTSFREPVSQEEAVPRWLKTLQLDPRIQTTQFIDDRE
jgi:hypothetical protein